MSKKSLFLTSALMLLSFQGVLAFQPKETTRYFNGPTVKQVTSTTANLSLSQSVLSGLTDEERQGVYFQYYETQLVCIAIYPTPEYCLPKKTEVGKADVTVTNLKPDTSYTVLYKRDNTIRCITTPCPGNEFESLTVEFVTKASNGTIGGVIKDTPSENIHITKNIGYGSRGEQVVLLQAVLNKEGHLTVEPTGYFGLLTLKAVKNFQKDYGITPTGFVGPLTRAAITKPSLGFPVSVGETFEGTITAYSTACFADGECSITVDGKKVVITIGWSQAVLGKVIGIPDFGSIENNMGAHAKVYAKKTADGYTLYGSSNYYVEITPKAQGKLPEGSATTTLSAIQGTTWAWKETWFGDSIRVPGNVSKFTITIGTDGKISGTTDCNNFFGEVTFGSDGYLTVDQVASTRMYCQGSEESTFIDHLSKVRRFLVHGNSNNLNLIFSETSPGVMYFVKK